MRLRVVVLLVAILPLVACRTKAPVIDESAPRPNIVMVFTDDHAWQAISAYSDRLMQTPSIDRLAREGMRFQRAYVPNSICGPSRACVLTGKYSHKNGLYRNSRRPFDNGQWSFPKTLRGAGYETALIGKWHLGDEQAPQGFDYSAVLVGQGPYYNPTFLVDAHGNGRRTEQTITGYTTDIVTDEAIAWLARHEAENPAKPFLLMVQHKAPHRPWMPAIRDLNEFEDETVAEPPTLFDDYEGMPRAARLADMRIADTMTARDLKLEPMPHLNDEQRAAWDAIYGPRNEAFRAANLSGRDLVRWKYQRYIKDYLRCIRAVDDNIGRMLEYLDKSGLAQNTVVVYCSDQGFFLGEHGWFDKRWLYEESLRTPLIVRWPGHTPAGAVNKADIVSVVDLAPTFCEIAGASAPADVQGNSMVPVLEGKTPQEWRKSFYFHYYEYPGWHAVRKHYGVVSGQYKLAYFYEEDMREWLLVDLVADPAEQRNFYNDPEYADVRARLHAELERLRAELEVPSPDPAESYVEGEPY